MRETGWRLILHPPGASLEDLFASSVGIDSLSSDAAWNMAVDEALLDSLLAGECLPTLRMYAWSPPAVSMGRHQRVSRFKTQTEDSSSRFHKRISGFSLSQCDTLGLPVVRRPTGGRAILHDREVTYSVVLPQSGMGIVESYKAISQGIRLGLERLGIASGLGQKAAAGDADSANCFAAATRSDLVTSGDRDPLKIVGSAQCRRGDALLQHGSLPLAWNGDRFAALFGMTPEECGASSLADLMGRELSWDEAAQALLEGFRELWGPEQECGNLTGREQTHALQLHEIKYTNTYWTEVGLFHSL